MFAEPIPADAERYGALAIARIDGGRRPCVKVWRGKQSRPYAHYSFQDGERREQWIKATKESEDQRQEIRATGAASKAVAIAAMTARLQVGTVLYTSWGYDQTNVDYYQIVAKRGRQVKVRKIGGWVASDSQQAEQVAPDIGNFIGPETAHVIQQHGLTIDGHSAWPCELGSTHHQTASGWGH